MGDSSEGLGLSEDEEDVLAKEEVLVVDECVGDAEGVVGQCGTGYLVECLIH